MELEDGSGETAIIMSILLPHYIWIATESKGNFKFQILIFQSRNIVAFPEKGDYINWLNKATELTTLCFKLQLVI